MTDGDDELCDVLKTPTRNGDCMKCLEVYSGHDPYCMAYMSDRKREDERLELMRDLEFE